MASSNIHLLGKSVNDDISSESCRFKVSCAVIKARDSICFPAFTTGEHSWRISCRPYQRKLASEIDYLTFWLSYEGEYEDVKVTFSIVLLKKDEESSSSKWKIYTHIFGITGSCIILENFIQGDELRSYLKDDYFTVICKITILNVACIDTSKIHLLGKPVNDCLSTESCQFKVSCAAIKASSFLSFPAFTRGGHLWSIHCRLKGDVAGEIDNLTFWLFYGGEWRDVKVNFNIALLKKDEASPSIKSKTTTHIFAITRSHFKLENFFGGDELRRYLKDDYFIVICEITILSVACMQTPNSGATILSSLFGALKSHSTEVPSKTTEMVSGSFRFRVACSYINGYEQSYFPIFMVGEYCWQIMCYKEKDETKLSFYLCSLSAIKNLKVDLEFGVLKKDEGPSSVKWRTCTHIFKECGSLILMDKFIVGDELKRYLQVDYLTVICNIIILSETIASDHHVTILGSTGNPRSHTHSGPAPSLQDHFSKLLQNKEKVDVTFEVNGEIFHAHRLVLAARSDVFDAQLYGPANENYKGRPIKVNAMEPRVFKMMLHFIYTNMLPDLNGNSYCESDGSKKMASIEMLEHLIVAADHYALESLKLICDNKLSKIITTDNVAATLAYAITHKCTNLKARCLEFASSRQNFMKMAQTDGYADLRMTYPIVVKELKAKIISMTA